MNRYKLVKAGINPNEGIDRFSKNIALYEKFLLAFPEDPNYDKMLAAIADNDVVGAFKAAHALKGVTGNLSLNRLYESVCPLVEELRAQSMEHVPELLEPVKENYETAVAALKEARGES